MQMNRESPKGLVTELRGRNGVTEMKVKHFLSGATLLSAALLLNAPLSAAVESDVVGYTTITTNPGFNMMGVVFNGLDGQALPLNEIVSGNFSNNDQIQIYNKDSSSTYTTYIFYNGQWVDRVEFKPATSPVSPGTAFWLNTPEHAVEVTLKGAIPTNEYTYTTKKGIQMLAANIPAEINPNDDIVWGEGLEDGDQLQIRNGKTYTTYQFYNGNWVDRIMFQPMTEVIPIGSSVWLTTKNEGISVTFQLPQK